MSIPTALTFELDESGQAEIMGITLRENPRGQDVDSLGELLKVSRRQAGLTQVQLAGLSTVSVRAIRDLELGKVQQPRRETVRLLAAALRLKGSRRAAFEVAAGGMYGTGTLEQACDVEQAQPPASIGHFVGHQSELHAVTELLGAERERLVTVVGAIGVGKTRLALEAAQALHTRSRVPILWVHMGVGPNAAAGLPQHVLANWVSEVIVGGGPFHELAQVIGNKPTQLVLDGVESPAAVHASLLQVLHSCPQLSVLVTTREPTPVLGGRLVPLAPLALPAPVAAGESTGTSEEPALALMMSYLRHLRPDILPTESVVATMARICCALDGLPQALESAASWLPLYAPHQLLEAAESFPLSLTEHMSAPDSEAAGSFRRSLEQSIARLQPQHASLLRVLAAKGTSWNIGDIARQANCTPVEALRGLHALLLRGLVRPVHYEQAGQGGLSTFTVLNLVRHLATPVAPAPRLLYSQREIFPCVI
ncbi:helix-turn-helix domain-containing protein [Plantactinospora sp. CA-290183]|uniref:helix-turn-helix domain-containing protein n=1 Tax=Plantactinospora sp. CA-290183 TaxID=3240006 RepID=UPI003D8B2D7C